MTAPEFEARQGSLLGADLVSAWEDGNNPNACVTRRHRGHKNMLYGLRNCQELWMRFLGQAATDPLLSVLVVSG
jgi:hypothetical protein